MAYIRVAASSTKTAPKWECAVTVGGLRKSKTFPTKKQAKDWGDAQEEQGLFTGHKLHEALAEYKKVAALHKGSASELSKINTIINNIPNMPLDQITDLVIIDYRNRRLSTSKSNGHNIGNGTVRREMGILSLAFDYAIKELKWMASNPAKGVIRPKSPAPRRRGITQDEINTVLETLKTKATITGEQLSCLFQLGIETGMRLSEMINLTWNHVHEKYVHLPMTKNGSARNVPLSPKARELIASRKGIDPNKVFTMTRATASQGFHRWTHNGIRFHDSRSEAIIRLSKKLSIMDLARAIGHDDINSLMFYYNQSPDQIADLL